MNSELTTLINKNDSTNLDKAISICKILNEKNLDVIIDDTEENFSSKLKKFNLIGIPYQILIGKKSEGDLLEFKEIGKESLNLSIKQIIDSLARNDSASKSLHSVTLCLSSALITSAGFWKVFSRSELQPTSMAINTSDRTINFFITISLIKSSKA